MAGDTTTLEMNHHQVPEESDDVLLVIIFLSVSSSTRVMLQTELGEIANQVVELGLDHGQHN